jgi:hypothetical protein
MDAEERLGTETHVRKVEGHGAERNPGTDKVLRD